MIRVVARQQSDKVYSNAYYVGLSSSRSKLCVRNGMARFKFIIFLRLPVIDPPGMTEATCCESLRMDSNPPISNTLRATPRGQPVWVTFSTRRAGPTATSRLASHLHHPPSRAFTSLVRTSADLVIEFVNTLVIWMIGFFMLWM